MIAAIQSLREVFVLSLISCRTLLGSTGPEMLCDLFIQSIYNLL